MLYVFKLYFRIWFINYTYYAFQLKWSVYFNIISNGFPSTFMYRNKIANNFKEGRKTGREGKREKFGSAASLGIFFNLT